jgi:hypothetical protein
MSVRPTLLLAWLALACAIAAPAGSADPPQEIHGMADAYAAQGVALAWAVLRGVDEATTMVVLRVATDASRYPLVAATGRNPFSQRTEALLRPTPTAGSIDLRVSRAHFADFPRTELRFYGSTPAKTDEMPSLTIYFLGVPDTTPEFASETDLAAYLADRVARLHAPGKRAP